MNHIITPTQDFIATGSYTNGHSRVLRPMRISLSLLV